MEPFYLFSDKKTFEKYMDNDFIGMYFKNFLTNITSWYIVTMIMLLDAKGSCDNMTLPILNGSNHELYNINVSSYRTISFVNTTNLILYFSCSKFIVYVKTKSNEGLYNLYYHNCQNYAIIPKSKQSFTVMFIDKLTKY